MAAKSRIAGVLVMAVVAACGRGAGSVAFGNDLVNDLIPYIESHYSALADREHPHAPLWLDVAARTSQEAADALGVSVGQIAKTATPAVVEIDATSAGNGTPFGGQGAQQSAEGTGFVYDTKGDIVTNEHASSALP